MQTIFRNNNKSGNFTCINNSILQSLTLSPDEIGVLVRLLSLPDNFVINKTSIWKTMNIGREHFNKVWNKLSGIGYIQTTKTIDVKSKHFEYSHSVHEIPVHQIPVHQESVHQEPVNGKLVSLIINNKKDPEEIYLNELRDKICNSTYCNKKKCDDNNRIYKLSVFIVVE